LFKQCVFNNFNFEPQMVSIPSSLFQHLEYGSKR